MLLRRPLVVVDISVLVRHDHRIPLAVAIYDVVFVNGRVFLEHQLYSLTHLPPGAGDHCQFARRVVVLVGLDGCESVDLAIA